MAGDGGAMADIFISYAREDAEVAQRIAQALESQGWSVWWDTRLKAGEIWDELIERELKAARSVVVLWSGESVNSRWVRKEARYGDTHRMLFPAMIETVDIPFEFSDVHAENLSGWTDDLSDLELRHLVGALAAFLGEPPHLEPNPPPPPENSPSFETFRDVDEEWCPEVTVLPSGEFFMGPLDTELDADGNEKPRHKVIIASQLAVGRYPVTFDEYQRFCDVTGCEMPEDTNWGRGRRPVVNVSWEYAKAYVEWLGTQTGKVYRLLGEAEWEYACRAGTTTRFSFGDTITEKDANFNRNVGKTTEVGSYPANPWGLYDMLGNVWEWVEDVWHDSYNGAPDLGGVWAVGGDKGVRVLRGGSWTDTPKSLRSANRNWNRPGRQRYHYGLRVARTL